MIYLLNVAKIIEDKFPLFKISFGIDLILYFTCLSLLNAATHVQKTRYSYEDPDVAKIKYIKKEMVPPEKSCYLKHYSTKLDVWYSKYQLLNDS